MCTSRARLLYAILSTNTRTRLFITVAGYLTQPPDMYFCPLSIYCPLWSLSLPYNLCFHSIKVNVKAKFTVEQATKERWGSRDTDLHFI